MGSISSRPSILVIDDHYAVESKEFYSRDNFLEEFTHLPFQFQFASAWDDHAANYSVAAAMSATAATKPDGILLDIQFGRSRTDRLGIEILRQLTRELPAIPVVMMTSVARDEAWAQCVRLGAVDYLPKPLDQQLLHLALNRYVGVDPEYWVVGQNHLFLDAVNLVALAGAGGQTPTMISGESGTGKTLLARFLHRHGLRSARPFEMIDLANIPGEMQSAELFGYRKGAFTGAVRDEPGRLLAADGGVIFLDEIGNIDGATQARLLRVVDSREISQLGGSAGKSQRIDVQVVSATNADLVEKIKSREFRYDLWARLNAMHVPMPSLAQRLDDVPQLTLHLLRCEAIRRGRRVPVIPDGMDDVLRETRWEGNVRGLRSYAQRVCDFVGTGIPDAVAFREALPNPTRTPEDRATPLAIRTTDIQNPTTVLQHLRLEEIALLDRALVYTRDPVSGAANRAKAAAWLKGIPKCSTNEFDRWLAALWNGLTSENQRLAASRFPSLAEVLKRPPGLGAEG